MQASKKIFIEADIPYGSYVYIYIPEVDVLFSNIYC